MLLFIPGRLWSQFDGKCFNTSHVTLYHLANKCVLVITQFQYISCYSLSPFVLLLKAQQAGFNTSHVTLYRYMGDIYIHRRTVSIHLMLLFILARLVIAQEKYRFQYISCYSLSRINNVAIFCDPEFQYISCYSLSQSTFHHLLNCLLFQYISCYSLSTPAQAVEEAENGFNTSHVTLYPSTLQHFSHLTFL